MKETVLLLAGEPSGDGYGAALAKALRCRRPDLRLVGTGGPGMEAEGVELLAGLDDLAVMGFAEVLPRLPFFRRMQRTIERIMDGSDARLVIPIDYPGFNLRIAASARRRGLRVLYYVAPKVWAWRPARARALADATDRVAVILPFEADLLRRSGVRAEYVGHPLLDREGAVDDESTFRNRWGLDSERPILALLPGSRPQEIARHLELFVAAGRGVRSRCPEVLPVVSHAPSLPRAAFAGLSEPVVDDARGLLRHARAALVKSGTATLEAAIERTPSVVAYRTSAATWMLAKRLLRTEHVSLPNLIAGGAVVPERLQGAATPEALAASLVPLLDEGSPERMAQLEGLTAVGARLGDPGAAERVADLAIELLEGAA